MSGKSGVQKGQVYTPLLPVAQNEVEDIPAPRGTVVTDNNETKADRKKKKKPEGNEQNEETLLPLMQPVPVNQGDAAGQPPNESGWISEPGGREEFSTVPNGQSNESYSRSPSFDLTSFNPLPDRDFPYSKKVSALSYMRDPLLVSDEVDRGTVDDALNPAETNIVRNYNAVVRLPHYVDPISGKTVVEKRPTCWDIYGFSCNARLYDADGRAFGTHPGEQPGSTKFIDQCITDMVVVKADHEVTAQQGVALADGGDRMTALINAKVAQLAGLDVTSNKPKETLDQVDPALARKVEQEWARVMKENQPKGQYSPSAAAKMGGLIKAGSSLDYAPSISDKFPAAAATASLVAATPVSSLPDGAAADLKKPRP